MRRGKLYHHIPRKHILVFKTNGNRKIKKNNITLYTKTVEFRRDVNKIFHRAQTFYYTSPGGTDIWACYVIKTYSIKRDLIDMGESRLYITLIRVDRKILQQLSFELTDEILRVNSSRTFHVNCYQKIGLSS